MSAPAGSILPSSYFDALSQLWGATAYVAASIAAAGLAFAGWMNRSDPGTLIRLLIKVFLVGLAMVFLREWLMRLGDVIAAFGNFFHIDPTSVDEKFIHFLSGTSPSKPSASAWDVIWDTGSIGTAIAYALLWLFGWFAYGVQFIVKLIGDILLSAGWALSPLFLSFFLLRPMAGVGLKYILGLVVLVCWPFGWVIAAVVTDAMLQTAATASLLPVVVSGGAIAPVLTVLIVGVWMLLSSTLAPYVLYRVLMSGANPAAAFAQGVGGVAQSVLAGGVGAATVAVTGGAAAPAVVAAAAVGAMAAGTESAARGGGSARTTATAMSGMSGFYGGRFMRQQTTAMEEMATAATRRAAASERFAAQYGSAASQTSFPHQPHHPNPNQAAIDIESHAS